LVAAMSGTAVAATLITSSQIKDGTIQLKDISPTARHKLKGQTGAKGAKGVQGLQGVQGVQGPAGDPSATLASGHSESGVYGVNSPNAGTGGRALLAPLTFTQPLAAPIDVGNVIEVPHNTAPVAHCAGEGSADPGYLCIYDGGATNLGSFVPGALTRFGAQSAWFPLSNTTFANAYGVYTVTAP